MKYYKYWDCEQYYYPCMHKTKEEALECIRANEEYLNSHCEKCKDGTTNRDCTYLSHKITIGMVEYSKWDILKGEEE